MKKIIIVLLIVFKISFTVDAQTGELITIRTIADNNCNGIIDPNPIDMPWPGTILYNLVIGTSPATTIATDMFGVAIFTLPFGQTATISMTAPVGCSIKLPLTPILGTYTIISNCFPGGPPCMGQQRSFLICCKGTGNTGTNPGKSVNDQDTTGLTSFCNDTGFESGQQINWSDWHAAYGNISGNSTSLDILNSNYTFNWGIKYSENTTTDIENMTAACSTYTCFSGTGIPSTDFDQVNQNHHLVVGSGSDPIVPLITKTHAGSAFSLKLGNSGSNNGFEFIEKKFVVTAANTLFSFWYAFVMSNPEHNAGENQYFGVDVFTASGSTITKITNVPTTGVNVNVGTGLSYAYSSDLFSQSYARNRFCTPTQVMTGGIKYKDWSYVSLDLSNQIGNTIVIRIWTRDCSKCGDFAYAYLDDFCSAVDNTNPTGSASIASQSNCGLTGTVCVNYTLPHNATATGTAVISMPVYQNGNLTPVYTLTSPTLTSTSPNPYCFNLNTIPSTLFAAGSTHFDYRINSVFKMNTTTPVFTQNIGAVADGQVAGNNNDYKINCPTTSCCSPWPNTINYTTTLTGAGSPTGSGIVANGGTILFNDNYYLSFPNLSAPCTNASGCTGTLTYSLYTPDNTPVPGFINESFFNSGTLWEQPCSNTGKYKIVIKAKCGTDLCNDFTVYIDKPCPPVGTCEGPNGYNITYSYNLPTGTPLSDYKIKVLLFQNGIAVPCTSPSLSFVPPGYTGSHLFYFSPAVCAALIGGCIDYKIIIEKTTNAGTTIIQTIGDYGNNGITAGMNNDLCCGTSPCLPNCTFTGQLWGVGMPPNGRILHCKDTINVQCNSMYQGGISLTCSNPSSTTVLTTGVITNAAGQIVTGLPFINYNFPNAGLYTYTYYKIDPVTNLKCDSCKITFNVTCIPSCICTPDIKFTNMPHIVPVTGGAMATIPSCGSTVPGPLQCNKAYNFTVNYQALNVPPGCIVKDSAVLTNSSNVVIASSSNVTTANPFTQTFTTGGTYCVTHYLTINGIVCQECKICFTVNCCDPTCQFTLSVKNMLNNQTTVCNTTTTMQLNCGQGYDFTRAITCSPANSNMIIKQVNVANSLGQPVPWASAFILASAGGVLNIPATAIPGVYTVTYTWGTANMVCGTSNFTFNITCQTDCCKGSYWETPITVYDRTTKAELATLDCKNPVPYRISNDDKNCDRDLIIRGEFVCSDIKNCPSKVEYKLTDNMGFIITGTDFIIIPANLPNGSYILSYDAYCGDQVCSSCKFEIKKDCGPQDCCKGGYWEKLPFISAELDNMEIAVLDCKKPVKIIIDDSHNTKYCNTMFVINAGKYICGDKNCESKIVYTLSDNNSSFILTGVSHMDIPADLPNGNYTLTMEVYCGDNICEKCEFPFIKNCKTCDCKTANCTFKTWYLDQSGTKKSFVCNNNLQLECNKTYPFVMNVSCQANCSYSVTAELLNAVGGVLQSQTNVSATNPFNVTFNTPGTNNYSIVYHVLVNGVECDTCSVNISVTCPPPVCTACNATVTATTKVSLTNNSSSGVSQLIQSFSFSGLPTSITEVRASVTNISIYATDDAGIKSEECLSCISNPNAWGSIVNGSGITAVTPKININGIDAVAPVTIMSHQNPRQIIWANAGNVFTVGSALQLSFLLPQSSTLKCCTRKATICVKFVFRDNNCTECIVYKCFDVDIK